MNQCRIELSHTFIENNLFIKRFLKRFLDREQDIEDVTQEVYIRAMRASDKKTTITQPKAFLFTIAKNLALNEISKKSNKATDYVEESLAEVGHVVGESMDSLFEKQERMEIYSEALSQLSEKCRQVFLLRKVYAFSHGEIAEQLDISVSSVEKYLRDAIVTCHQYLKTYEDKKSFARSYYSN